MWSGILLRSSRKVGFRLVATNAQQIIGVACLQRLPVIFPETPKLVEDFEVLKDKVDAHYAKDYPKGFLSDGLARAAQNPEIRNWIPAPRRTLADEKNDRRSLDRALDSRLYLLIKPKGGKTWQFPQATNTAGETIRQVRKLMNND